MWVDSQRTGSGQWALTHMTQMIRLMGMADESSTSTGVFTELYQQLPHNLLGRAWSPADGMPLQTLAERLAAGPISAELRDAHEPVLSVNDLPISLVEFYLCLGSCPELLETTHFFFDPDEFFIVDDHLVFLEDEEESAAWGIPVDQLPLPDPLLWRRTVGADTPDGEGDWLCEDGTISEVVTDVITWALSDPDEDAEDHA